MIYLIYFEQILIKIIKSLEDSGLLIDGVTETLKNEIKKQEVDFLEPC